MSTLRERIEALAKEYEAHAARIPWGDKCDALMSHAQDLRFALESETREAPGREARGYVRGFAEGRRAGIEEAARAVSHQPDGADDVFTLSRACSRIRSLSTPPPANTENDR